MSHATSIRESDLSPGDIRRVETENEPIAVCNVDGAIYAFSDTCTHGDWALSEGWLDGPVIECALHMAKFDVRTGQVLSPPATCPLKIYKVEIVDGSIYIDIDNPVSAGANT